MCDATSKVYQVEADDGSRYVVEELNIPGFEAFQPCHTKVVTTVMVALSPSKLSPHAKPFTPTKKPIRQLAPLPPASLTKRQRWNPNAPSSKHPTRWCKLSDLEVAFRPGRGGITPMTTIEGQNYYCFAFDWNTREVTDMAGGIRYGQGKTSARYRKRGPLAKNAIDGSLIEFHQESLNIFKGLDAFASGAAGLPIDSTVLYNDNMMNIIVPIKGICPMQMVRDFNAAFEAKIRKDGKHEISGLCWIPEIVLLARINGVQTIDCDIDFYSKVAIFFRGGMCAPCAPHQRVPIDPLPWWNRPDCYAAPCAPREPTVSRASTSPISSVQDWRYGSSLPNPNHQPKSNR